MASGIEALREDVAIAVDLFWGLYYSTVAIVLRERGELSAIDLIQQTMRAEQGYRYNDGLLKLGISLSAPPAVKAAQYHYLSNSIGGLNMEYIEESPKKVWIRYRAPTGSFPDVGLIAIPRSLRRAVFSTWHPRNGELMGCPQLQWVLTKLTCDGYPYDEGYFIERDYDIPVNERTLFIDENAKLEFNRSEAPRLDSKLWPEERLLKAQRNFGHDYFRQCLDVMLGLHDRSVGLFLMTTGAKVLAVQRQNAFRSMIERSGNPSSDSGRALSLMSKVFRACRLEVEIADEAGHPKLRLNDRRLSFGNNGELFEVFVGFFGALFNCIYPRLALQRTRTEGMEVWAVVEAR